MRKILICLLLLLILTTDSGSGREKTAEYNAAPSMNTSYYTTMKRDLLCLMLAYPVYIKSIEADSSGNVYAVMKSGKRLIYDDRKVKSFSEKMYNPDLQDVLEQIYPLSNSGKLMNSDFDPGRIRHYALLGEVYGSSKAKVASNLVNVSLGGSRVQFNKCNNASDALKSVMQELMPLARGSSRVCSALFPSSGTFNYRVISGTGLLSPHSFGIAIDMARDRRDYWQWASREQGQKRLDAYPGEIPAVFEKHNFIWGGKWGHFDILHYEYRPEIVLKARHFGDKPADSSPWFGEVMKSIPEAEASIKIIDSILK